MVVEPRAEKAYEKYAWIILLIPNAAFIFTSWLFAPGSEAASALSWDQIKAINPRILDYVLGLFTTMGLFSLLSALFGITVAAFPYRKGEKWAWFVYWALPAILLGLLANELSLADTEWQVVAGFLIISLIGIVLPYRKFFPRKV